ncbi:hypothetical protein CWS02_09555 [Enterobacter sp. EA-1]|nr:hypothetical protein CWS02_09555 [Enterobacter sp. EA-1]
MCRGNSDNCSVLLLSENVGIAAAQNMGIAEAAKHSCSHVLFMDHDSIPAHDMVSVLLHVENTILRREAPTLVRLVRH